MSFSKYALVFAHLDSRSGLLETIAKIPLNVAGTRLGNGRRDALQAITCTVLGASRWVEEVPVPSNLCCSQNPASSLNLSSSPPSFYQLCSLADPALGCYLQILEFQQILSKPEESGEGMMEEQ